MFIVQPPISELKYNKTIAKSRGPTEVPVNNCRCTFIVGRSQSLLTDDCSHRHAKVAMLLGWQYLVANLAGLNHRGLKVLSYPAVEECLS